MTKFCINATWDDVPHLTAEQKQELWDSYPPHMRKTRAQGIPMQGSGAVFPIDEETIAIEAFQMPVYWPFLGALDFGYDHPFAAVELRYDPDADVVYVTKAYRSKQTTPILHVAAIKEWGWAAKPGMPWAWPHDGLQHSKDSGVQLARQYEGYGLNMLGTHATFPDGSIGVEAGLFDMLVRMQTGRFFVLKHLTEWFEEFRRYHRKVLPNGTVQLVKLSEDLLSATRYGVMMLRHALLTPQLRSENRERMKKLHGNALGGDPLTGF